MTEELKIKEIELKIEKSKASRMQQYHNFRMDELNLRLKIAELYRSKKHKNKIKKELKKLKEKK